jgi:peptidyl-prolyl cis-trans isomerase C
MLPNFAGAAFTLRCGRCQIAHTNKHCNVDNPRPRRCIDEPRIRRARNMISRWRQLTREPLVRFFAAGALIFLVANTVQHESDKAARRILIDAQLEQRLISVNEAQYGVTPTSQQLGKLVENYVAEEMLYRQAIQLGLDRDDEIIRRRLIQKMQFLQRDMASAAAPARADLRAYYESHPTLFVTPESVSFQQLFFSADRGGSSAALGRAEHARAVMRGENAPPAGSRSDEFPLSIPEEPLTRDQAAGIFGTTPIVDALFATPENQWSAPVRSAFGWHLVRVTRRQAPGRLPFDAVEDQVRGDFLTEQAAAAEQQQLNALRSHFEIVRASNTHPPSS